MRGSDAAFLLLASTCTALPADYPTVPMLGIAGSMRMPLMGFGTWEYNESYAESRVAMAFQVGYRAVDTAMVYENHKGVGRALKSTGLPREEYFVTTKIDGGSDFDTTTANLDKALEELQLEFVDLVLVHSPADWDCKHTSAASRQEQWLAMEKWAKTGKARALGVSHYCRHHLEDVLSVATVPVALNQVEYHVGMGSASDEMQHNRGYMEQLGIVFMSFSTLCGPCPNGGNKELQEGELVTSIGNAHGKSGAQISLKWAVQQGIPVVPKSSSKKHMIANMDIFDFVLTQQEMRQLSSKTSPPQTVDDAGDCAIGREWTDSLASMDLPAWSAGAGIGAVLVLVCVGGLWLCGIIRRRRQNGNAREHLDVQLVGPGN